MAAFVNQSLARFADVEANLHQLRANSRADGELQRNRTDNLTERLSQEMVAFVNQSLARFAGVEASLHKLRAAGELQRNRTDIIVTSLVRNIGNVTSQVDRLGTTLAEEIGGRENVTRREMANIERQLLEKITEERRSSSNQYAQLTSRLENATKQVLCPSVIYVIVLI